MRTSSIQFAPSRRLQDSSERNRRTIYVAAQDPRRKAVAAVFTSSARNVRITWKVILLLWLALMTALCLRASAPDSSRVSHVAPAAEFITSSRVILT